VGFAWLDHRVPPACGWHRAGLLPRQVLHAERVTWIQPAWPDLIALGHAPGPGYRSVLDAALAAQDEGAFSDHAGAIAWLQAAPADVRLQRRLAAGRPPASSSGRTHSG
jgi:hypothetical protein